MLYLVSTPIGNLKDITLRALEVLKEADEIICEDTRRASVFLNHYQIHKPLTVLNDFNEVKVLPFIINKLQAGTNLALISDAGTPLISDPGYKLVRECLAQDIRVDSLPGPSSVITALTLSGLPPDKFFFLGYLPEKSSHRLKLLNSLSLIHETIEVTYIAFVSPHKLIKTLADLKETFGNIEIVLARELTKIHQEVVKLTIEEWLSKYIKQTPKGEYVALFRLG